MATKRKAAKKPSRTFQLRKEETPKTQRTNSDLVARMQTDLKTNQAVISIVLGILIVIVLGVSIFNFLSKPSQNAGPTSQTQQSNVQPNQGAKQAPTADVSKNNLPGNYTVKDGDTLFTIAQSYYGDGYQYQKIADANKIQDVNNISTGQVLNIPKLDTNQQAMAQTQNTQVANPSPNPIDTPNTQYVQGGTGGSPDQTEWGTKISGNTYTVQEGDWLSKIAGRAYGDIYQYTKIAQANNISDPNMIEPGTVLQIPR